MKILPILAVWAIAVSTCSKVDGETEYLNLNVNTYTNLSIQYGDKLEVLAKEGDQLVVKTDQQTFNYLPESIHNMSGGMCGGFFATATEAEAREMMRRMNQPLKPFRRYNYRIRGSRVVDLFTSKVEAANIRNTIDKLSNGFKTRYYKSETGVQSQIWLSKLWQSFNVHRRADFSVKLYKHDKWPQPSVIGAIRGTERPDEYVVIGGHGDSIVGFGGSSRSPGADDNASGVSAVSEILRVLLSSTYQPKRTILFMSYAAEEVGLRGSKEIAKAYRAAKKNVVGVMQLDMTNHKTEDGVISFVRDNTDDKLTSFTQALADRYLPNVKWVDDRCGYACSDHASWNAQGYAAVFPFESRVGKMNRKIHTKNDTLQNSDSSAQHAAIFAKLGIAWAMEMTK